METTGQKTREQIQLEIESAENALADVRLERELALTQRAPCSDLVGSKAAWDRDEKRLTEQIAALKAALDQA